MRIYIFLCLMCWVRFETKKTCLEFSKLNVVNSLLDLFSPKLKIIQLLYSRNNLNCAEPLFEPNNSLNVHFNLSKKTVWIIHGYRPLGSTPSWLSKITKVLLEHEDVNLIVVDWNQGATTFIYSRAVKNTRRVAESLRESIQNLLDHGASLDSFHLVGMSLGAHIGGFVGKLFHGQLGRITGLDPAGPQFSGKPSNSRLHYTDAKFVDVIHTDSDGLGILEPLGHIDFYPNGGKKQPGCPTTLFSGVNYIKCDHQRAVHLFIAAFETNCNFVSFPCGSYKDYMNGLCVDCENVYRDTCPSLGNQAQLWKEGLKKRMVGRPFRTIAFLDTRSEDPFCTYYFVLSIVALNETMRGGSISFRLLNSLERYEYPRLYVKSKPFDNNLQEVKILVQFIRDIVNISCIFVTYLQPLDSYCSTCQYGFQSLVLKSLTHPERPPFCKYDFVLKDRKETELLPEACKTQMV